MPVERASQLIASKSASASERSGLVEIPPDLEQFAVRHVASSPKDSGHAAPAEIGEVAASVVAAVLEMQVTPAAVMDARALSDLGGRLLDAMRDELMRRWRAYGIKERQLSVLLLAMARAREAIGNRAAHQLVSQLGGNAGLELLGEVAHDMHSPLASILVLADTLQREESGPLTEMQRRQLGLISTAALGLSSVGSDIMDLTRSHLLLEPKPIPFSVASVLESVADIVRPIAEVKRLAVRLEPPHLDERVGHPVALRRVLLNLTTNALKFTEHGFVEIGALETSPGRVEFAVRDSGRGIEPAMMPTLFDSVRDAPRGYDQRAGKMFSTTGLGLAICRKLAAGMGSQLKVETQLGRGTRFFFELELPELASRRDSGRTSDPARRRQETPAA
ncbi:MAG TPA: HAMP domain-containing sensor histidine kinase [Gemmatimonadales bacterium]|nr:HAMP domain-containing sensor histidine kinase [Gemmatimonadales bacterium]